MSEYAEHPTLVHAIEIKPSSSEEEDFDDRNKDVNGLAILAGELFLLVGEYKTRVEVYDATSFLRKRRFPLDEISIKTTFSIVNARDLASCEKEKCLYAVGWTGADDSVMVKTNPDGKILKKWSIGSVMGGLLSVTDQSTVIFADSNGHRLLEYSPDGELIREIALPAAEKGGGCGCAGPAHLEEFHINYPWHAVRLTTTGQFVVAHGYLHFGPLHRVCLIDEAGKFQKSFGEGRGSGTAGQMEQPNHVAVDGNGNIFVADKFNDCVILLNSELAFCRVILSKGEQLPGHPHRIVLEESKGRLYVAFSHEMNDRVLVFQIR